MRLGLETFETAHEAARAYDAAAWRLRRPHREMNFHDVPTQERAQELAPPSRLITKEDRRDNRRRESRLGIAEMDKEAMALWCQRFPQEVANKNAFWVKRRATRNGRTSAAGRHWRYRSANWDMRHSSTKAIIVGTTGFCRHRTTPPRRRRTTRSSF
ncbi:Ethylene-responsive transcription factor CRF1 [Hordeum vulgare]|nr:Ethylene-responsive transcription factor CRF1 [Hordeum vulgare]KAE8774261.1 Ethylene-responsive transcription factor CRF1 [Hordeum vulgare]